MIKQIHTAAEDHVQYAKAILRAIVLAMRPLNPRPFPEYHATLAQLFIEILLDPTKSGPDWNKRTSILTYPRLF
jgi:hypothetical protein